MSGVYLLSSMQEPSPKSWCGRTELNCRHPELQSGALPTELLPQINFHIVKDLYSGADEGSRTHTPSLIPGSEPSVATITPHPHFVLGDGFEPTSDA